VSLMRINHVSSEIRKLGIVINKLILNYKNDFKEYDLSYKEEKDSLNENIRLAQESNDCNLLANAYEKEASYTQPLGDLKSLAQFQNELMLVKHTALIESMIINIFRCLVNISKNKTYEEEYFSDGKNFSDSYLAANKISEMTGKDVDLKRLNFWHLYETLKTMRNSIAHGDPLFVLSYRRVSKFNKEIDIVTLYSEVNYCKETKSLFPSLLHPTFDKKANWHCHMSNNIENLSTLNNRCLNFVEETKKLFLAYGQKHGIPDHKLYSSKS
jgi:hypothetical protein